MRNKFLLSSRSGGKFLPSDIAGLEVWIDPSQTDTITTQGNYVEQVDDLTGNGNHATGFLDSGLVDFPFESGQETMNGLNVLNPAFTNSMFFINLPTPILDPYTPEPMTIFTIMSMPPTPDHDTTGIYSAGFPNFTGATYKLADMSTSAIPASNWTGGSINTPHAVNMYVNNVKFTQDLVQDLTQLNLYNYFDNNDTDYVITFTHEDGYFMDVNDDRQFFALKFGGYSFNNPPGFAVTEVNPTYHRLGEVLFYSRILSTAEIDQVNAYLGNKWGITQSSGTYTFP